MALPAGNCWRRPCSGHQPAIRRAMIGWQPGIATCRHHAPATVGSAKCARRFTSQSVPTGTASWVSSRMTSPLVAAIASSRVLP